MARRRRQWEAPLSARRQTRGARPSGAGDRRAIAQLRPAV